MVVNDVAKTSVKMFEDLKNRPYYLKQRRQEIFITSCRGKQKNHSYTDNQENRPGRHCSPRKAVSCKGVWTPFLFCRLST